MHILVVEPHDPRVESFRRLIREHDPMGALLLGMLFGGDRWSCVAACALACENQQENQQIVGMATLAPSDEGGEGGPHIIGVYVLPLKRRQGMGRAMMETLVGESRLRYQRGATFVALSEAELALCRGIADLTVRTQ